METDDGTNDLNPPHPVVFISYSHDSSAHKKWVGELAGKLMAKGVDVTLDLWDLEPGDDVPKFMEQAVKKASKVLMICTEIYVRKADEGKGGVGYESMIVTGELVKDLGTSKFIPVIRQEEESCAKPVFVSTRFHINLSDGQEIEEQFNSLVQAIHRQVRATKPPIGANPFPVQPEASIPPLRDLNINVLELSKLFNESLEIARREDLIAWRRLSALGRKSLPEKLATWRQKYEREGLTPRNLTDRSQLIPILMGNVAEGVSVYAPLMAMSLAGVLSGNVKFNNQRAILDDMLHPRDWNRSGSTDIADLPLTVAFVYQSLHGATCLYSDQLSLAIRLARERVTLGYGGERNPLYKESGIIGWPPTLGGDSKVGWDFLWNLSERWTWLSEVFGETDEYRVSLCAYHIGLTLLELVETIAQGNEAVLDQARIRLEVPMRFPVMDQDIVRRAYRMFLNNPEQITEIWRSQKVAKRR